MAKTNAGLALAATALKGVLSPIPNAGGEPSVLKQLLMEQLLVEESMHEIVPGLYLGSQYAAGHSDPSSGMRMEMETVAARLRERNIRYIICATVLENECSVDGVSQLTVPFSDAKDVDLIPVLGKCFSFLDSAFMESGTSVLVHCQMGQSRSAAIVIAYLMREKQWTFQEAYDFCKSKRKYVTDERFGGQLRKLEGKIATMHGDVLGTQPAMNNNH